MSMRNKSEKTGKEPEKRTDDFEDILRRTMCIFICLEAVGLSCFIALGGRPTYSEYFFHEEGESFIKMFLESCGVIAMPLLMSVLPLLFKPIYYLTEILHVFVGIIAFWVVAVELSILLAIPASLIFSGRFLLYLFIIKNHNKYISNSIIRDVRANIEREKDDRLR